MKKNLGKFDKVLRMALGILIIIIGAQKNSVLGVLGIIPILTAQIGFCPLYALLGICTVPKVPIGHKK